MVVRLEKLPVVNDSNDHSMKTRMTPGQVTFPASRSKPPLQQTIAEVSERETSAGPEGRQEDTASADDTQSLCSSVAVPSSSLSWSCSEDRTDSRSSRRSVGRDRSHTWSHSTLAVRTARRSGSLPAMDCSVSHVPKLDLNRGDSPYPSTPTCVSPFKSNRLLVCSEHRMSTSPRLPPIGCLSDLHSPRSLPKNSPREFIREVSNIDPGLIDNADPTEVRMMGRRRNALMTPQPTIPDNGS